MNQIDTMLDHLETVAGATDVLGTEFVQPSETHESFARRYAELQQQFYAEYVRALYRKNKDQSSGG